MTSPEPRRYSRAYVEERVIQYGSGPSCTEWWIHTITIRSSDSAEIRTHICRCDTERAARRVASALNSG